MKAPVIYIKEGDKIVERVAPIVDTAKCWWCLNPFMYEVTKYSIYGDSEITYFQCVSCGARQDMWGKLFQAGIGERKEGAA